MADDDSDQEYDHTKVTLAYPSEIRVGDHIVIENRPCKVLQVHRYGLRVVKFHFLAKDIFLGKEVDFYCSSKPKVEVPIVSRSKYSLVDISSYGYLCLLTEMGETKDDVRYIEFHILKHARVPQGDLGKQLKDSFKNGKEITCNALSSMDEEVVYSFESN